mgnify:CR=1 FL=1
MQVVVITMTLYLYNISADTRCLTKVNVGVTPAIKTAADIEPTEGVDVLTPSFILGYDSSYLSCNYLYCAELNRYYYITEMTIDTAQRIHVQCSVDVLQTYADSIKNCMATVVRSESVGHPTMYSDSKLPVYPTKKNVTSIVMQQVIVPLNSQLSTADGDNYLLTVIGGEPHVN